MRTTRPALSVTLLSLVCLMSGCSSSAPVAEAPGEATLSDAEARSIVEAMIAEWDANANAGSSDAAAAASMYADDAVRLQPGMPALVGRSAIEAWLEAEGEAFSFEGSNEIVEVRALSPDWIMMRTTGTFTGTPLSGGEPFSQEEQVAHPGPASGGRHMAMVPGRRKLRPTRRLSADRA